MLAIELAMLIINGSWCVILQDEIDQLFGYCRLEHRMQVRQSFTVSCGKAATYKHPYTSY